MKLKEIIKEGYEPWVERRAAEIAKERGSPGVAPDPLGAVSGPQMNKPTRPGEPIDVAPRVPRVPELERQIISKWLAATPDESLRPNPQPLPSDQVPESLRPNPQPLPSDKAPDYLRPNHAPVPDDRPGVDAPRFDPLKAAPTRREVRAGIRADAKAGVDESLQGKSLLGQYARDKMAEKLNTIPLIGNRMGRFLSSAVDPEKQVVGQYFARHASDVANDVKPGFNKAPEAEYVNDRLAKTTDFKVLPKPATARAALLGAADPAMVEWLKRKAKAKKAAEP